jgi:peroxiredoxin
MADYLHKNPLPFPMLIDEDRQVMKQFEVFNRFSWDAFHLAHPSAFLIDPQGQVCYSFVASNQWDWPRTQLLADELARLRQVEAETVMEEEADRQ